MQAYSDPERESDPYALPDVEVFYLHSGPRRAYDRAYVMDHCQLCCPHGCDECPAPGWYYWYCFPGCMPDSEPTGPFESEEAALEDCRDNAGL